jgi:hypothetical protein
VSLQSLSGDPEPLRSGRPCCFEPSTQAIDLAGHDCGLYEWTEKHLDMAIPVVLSLCSGCILGMLHTWHEKQTNEHHEVQSPGCWQVCRHTAAVIETLH